MSEKLEVSFNSPQCGWMSIGFSAGENEFNTTTAHAPHSNALSDFLQGIRSLVESKYSEDAFIVHWSRNPEAYDFHFNRHEDELAITVVEFPTIARNPENAEEVFNYRGDVGDVAKAFLNTFEQLFAERDVDEFEDNWHQKFPLEEFAELKDAISQ